MLRVLVDMAVHHDSLERLRNSGLFEIDIIESPEDEESRSIDPGRLHGTSILFCSATPSNFDDFDELKLIQISSVGYSQLYPLNLHQRKIRVCNARGVFDAPIAEWNIAMMIALVRDLPGMLRNQEKAIWDRAARFQGEIRNSTVGIWGYGGIGRETARLCKQMGLTVFAMTRGGVQPRDDVYHLPGTGDPEGTLPDRVFTHDEVNDFLSELDFLILAVPLTPQTEGLIGTAELRALPDTAYLLNPARGPVVAEQALITALDAGWIAGAALDTHYAYPMPKDHPLWRFPNVIMTPHISGSSLSPFYLERIWSVFEENARRFASGDHLINELTKGQLAGA